MAEVLLYHHIQGLTDGVRAFAEDLRRAGHTVHTPDLFDGRTFASIDEGFAFAEAAGIDELRVRGTAAADGLSSDLVYAGLSFGVMIAQQLAQTKPGARGALLMHSCIPVAEFGQSWPPDVPVQIHGMRDDEFFDEDLPAARELAGSAPAAELYVYPGDRHLFTDSSLGAFDEDAAALLLERVHSFLAGL
ncbi:dienelactone hydrolase family protein [Brevibacterium renqingii]|uniref:dienelactone hydrolase family protein n=1 Tax=Brevibacterium renqingii TaxID=2776916 RepID=UPI001AE06AE2|nr:dienelactone hydrolase family protein [Brevibacterium renqingii]